MYLRPLKTLIVEAWQAVFSDQYPLEDLRNLPVGIEYPIMDQSAPAVWVSYDDTEPLTIAGIDHREIVVAPDGDHLVTRWTFGGRMSMTVVAFTSLERDRLVDEIVRVLAFARAEQSEREIFRNYVDNNDLIGLNINFDEISMGPEATSVPPWGTTQIVYERTLSLDVIGEFVSDPSTNQLVNLSSVQVQAYIEDDPVPEFPDETIPAPKQTWNPHVWH